MIENSLAKRTITGVFLIFLVFLIFNSMYFMVSGLLIIGVISILEFLNLTKIIFKKKIY